MKRSLSLKRETLAELATDELVRVAGANQAATQAGLTCPIAGCLDVTLSCPERTCNCCTASASC